MRNHFIVVNITGLTDHQHGHSIPASARPTIIQNSLINARTWVEERVRQHPNEKYVIFESHSLFEAHPVAIKHEVF